MKKTKNDLIHIGCPIPFDVEEFLGQLEILMETAYKNKSNIRELVEETVKTYGRVPSNETMSEFNADIDKLCVKYNDIYMAVKDIVSEDELPAEGKNVNTYVEAAKKSKIRFIHEQIEQAKCILTNFIAVKSRLDIYEQALKPRARKGQTL